MPPAVREHARALAARLREGASQRDGRRRLLLAEVADWLDRAALDLSRAGLPESVLRWR